MSLRPINGGIELNWKHAWKVFSVDINDLLKFKFRRNTFYPSFLEFTTECY